MPNLIVPVILKGGGRILAYLFLIWGGFAIFATYHDEQRGVTAVYQPGTIYAAYTQNVVKRADDPEKFRDAMKYQWLRASVPLVLSMILFGIIRQQDRLDPMSPRFAGNKALDELSDELDREKRRRERPLR
jgi:hypothetical protein